MTAQQYQHLANLAAQRARLADPVGRGTGEAWDAWHALALLACSVGDREIATQGFTLQHKRLA